MSIEIAKQMYRARERRDTAALARLIHLDWECQKGLPLKHEDHA